MVASGEALIWTMRWKIAILDLPGLGCRTPIRAIGVYAPTALSLSATSGSA